MRGSGARGRAVMLAVAGCKGRRPDGRGGFLRGRLLGAAAACGPVPGCGRFRRAFPPPPLRRPRRSPCARGEFPQPLEADALVPKAKLPARMRSPRLSRPVRWWLGVSGRCPTPVRCNCWRSSWSARTSRPRGRALFRPWAVNGFQKPRLSRQRHRSPTLPKGRPAANASDAEERFTRRSRSAPLIQETPFVRRGLLVPPRQCRIRRPLSARCRAAVTATEIAARTAIARAGPASWASDPAAAADSPWSASIPEECNPRAWPLS